LLDNVKEKWYKLLNMEKLIWKRKKYYL
jgi:hypothetical protein